MNFAALTFIDASRATASYIMRYRNSPKDGDDWPLPYIALRSHGRDEPILSEWKTMRTVLSMIRAAGAPLLDGKPALIENAMVFSIKPRERIEWQDPPESPGAWLWLTMVPSPSAMIFSGVEGHLPPVNMLTAVSRQLPFSIVNLAQNSATFLVLDARKPE